MIGSDGIYQEDGLIHPRLFGTAARILGRCVRDFHLFTLEEAVYKLSGYSAKRFGLSKRGTIQEGYWADLVSFDASAIEDRATFDDPRQFPTGIGNVWVNGIPIWDHGKTIQNDRPPLPGRFLRGGRLTEFSNARIKC
jgi:N-acyl-D-aspartate/D-glutamate deacylase